MHDLVRKGASPGLRRPVREDEIEEELGRAEDALPVSGPAVAYA